jgi:hypothetical protein
MMKLTLPSLIIQEAGYTEMPEHFYQTALPLRQKRSKNLIIYSWMSQNQNILTKGVTLGGQ